MKREPEALTISELIEALAAIRDEYGDLPVFTYDGEYDDVNLKADGVIVASGYSFFHGMLGEHVSLGRTE